MIDPAQIRAARALLGWTQEQLGGMSDVTKNWISQIEREKVTASQEKIDQIQQALEEAGVEFLPNSGVRKKDRIVDTYEGPGSNKRLIDDIYQTLRDTGGELLVAHLNEDEAIKNLGGGFIRDQIDKRREAGITHRLLVRTNDPGLIPPLDTYHIMPDEYFSEYLLWIYGSKVALVAWEPEKSVVINDERFADCARKLFNFIWDNTDPIS